MKKGFKKELLKKEKTSLGMNILHIGQYFPGFKYNHKGKFWIGKLNPNKIQEYIVKVFYYHDRPPKVYVLEPKLLEKAPHLFPDRSLCLYFPDDFSYTEKSIIADTIIPWTAEWLYYYEKWLEDGVWWGPEAPHAPDSKRGKKINRKNNI